MTKQKAGGRRTFFRPRSNAFSKAPHDLIGMGLRELYSRALEEPVPDRFIELLNQLEQSTPALRKNNHEP